jgi:hypothetical protein
MMSCGKYQHEFENLVLLSPMSGPTMWISATNELLVATDVLRKEVVLLDHSDKITWDSTLVESPLVSRSGQSLAFKKDYDHVVIRNADRTWTEPICGKAKCAPNEDDWTPTLAIPASLAWWDETVLTLAKVADGNLLLRSDSASGSNSRTWSIKLDGGTPLGFGWASRGRPYAVIRSRSDNLLLWDSGQLISFGTVPHPSCVARWTKGSESILVAVKHEIGPPVRRSYSFDLLEVARGTTKTILQTGYIFDVTDGPRPGTFLISYRSESNQQVISYDLALHQYATLWLSDPKAGAHDISLSPSGDRLGYLVHLPRGIQLASNGLLLSDLYLGRLPDESPSSKIEDLATSYGWTPKGGILATSHARIFREH